MAGRHVYVRPREARAALSVLDTVSAYTAEELAEQFGWDDADVEAWAALCGKLRPIGDAT
jgi:hypothetical protein